MWPLFDHPFLWSALLSIVPGGSKLSYKDYKTPPKSSQTLHHLSPRAIPFDHTSEQHRLLTRQYGILIQSGSYAENTACIRPRVYTYRSTPIRPDQYRTTVSRASQAHTIGNNQQIQEVVPPGPSTRDLPDPELSWKTVLCKHFYKEDGWCPLGEQCAFIHDPDLRPGNTGGGASLINSSRLRAQRTTGHLSHCWAYIQARCHRGSNCPHNHPANIAMFKKYTPCINWRECRDMLCEFKHSSLRPCLFNDPAVLAVSSPLSTQLGICLALAYGYQLDPGVLAPVALQQLYGTLCSANRVLSEGPLLPGGLNKPLPLDQESDLTAGRAVRRITRSNNRPTRNPRDKQTPTSNTESRSSLSAGAWNLPLPLLSKVNDSLLSFPTPGKATQPSSNNTAAMTHQNDNSNPSPGATLTPDAANAFPYSPVAAGPPRQTSRHARRMTVSLKPRDLEEIMNSPSKQSADAKLRQHRKHQSLSLSHPML